MSFPVFERVVDLFVFDCDFKLEGANSLLVSLRVLAVGFLRIYRDLKFRNLVLEGFFAPFREVFLVRLRQAGVRDRELPVAALDDGGVLSSRRQRRPPWCARRWRRTFGIEPA